VTETTGGKRLRIRAWLCTALIAGGAVASALTVAGFASGLWRPCELTSHFRAQYFLCLGGAAITLALLRRRVTGPVFAAFALVNLAVLLPLFVGGEHSARRPDTLRAMTMNIHTANRDVQKVCDAIREYEPDFVLLLEVNDRWLADLGELAATYPHVRGEPREDNFGIALFSRLPFRTARIAYVDGAKVPSVLAELEAPGGVFTVFGTHPLPPSCPSCSRLRNQQLAAIPEALARVTTPVVLMGDLNVTPFSVYFERLLKASGLRDSARGRGYQPTWPTDRPMFFIPIDHCLHSPDIGIVDRQVGPNVGSDHYPLIVDFNLPADGRRPSRP